METSKILSQEIQTLLETKQTDQLGQLLGTSHPATIAETISGLTPEQIWQVLGVVGDEQRAEVFSHLDADLQSATALSLSRAQLVGLLTHMSPDDRVDLFKRIPEEQAESVLPALAQAEREDIRKLAAYPEGSAGSIMTSEYATLPVQISAGEAIAKLRREAPDKETIYYSYVVDEGRHLIGLVTLKDLILARPEMTVEQIMQREVIQATVLEDQEEAARKISRYDLLALPVVNEKGVLVGIVTYDDAMDVLNQEHTEDMEKFMAIAGKHEEYPYLRTPVWLHFRNRVVWIIVLAALGLISGFVIRSFEATLVNLLILATYMPMLADTGGNAGSQSATVVIRALALGQISTKDTLRILWKELRISTLLSAVLGVLTFGRVVLLTSGAELPVGMTLLAVGLAISLALALQVISAAVVGAVLPMVASWFKADPAVVASPALTTVVDITGLLIYFSTVKLLLRI